MDNLTAMVLANDRLLKAVMVLLSIKDEHLHDELCMVFDHARAIKSPLAEGPQRVWDHVQHELEIVGALARDADETLVS